MNTIIDEKLQVSDSYKELKKIVEGDAPIKSFHHHTHVLVDLRDLLSLDDEIVYMEIGSYVGASACMMLQHPNPTHVFCIDPFNLPRKHFGGIESQLDTTTQNLNRFKGDNVFTVMPYKSEDPRLHKRFNDDGIKADILFIDGDHSYNGVKRDWNLFNALVNRGGFVVFDDYLDSQYSPEVRKAVDDIVKDIITNNLPYEIVGVLPNYQNAYICGETEYLNEFILYKTGD